MKDISNLISIKKKIILPLLFTIIFSYFLFIIFIAYFPELLGKQLTNSSISYGIIFGFLLILIIFIVTLVYVFLSNKYIEPEIKKITS
ncbi:MAG: DUF485 domain-containing protein [Betaproteobacteria bacterium]|nr:DUF485 domain-containing protein [Betaproteobacteria bacterium]